MSCCGKQRQQFFGTLPVPSGTDARRPQPAVRFEYVGMTGLSVLGPVTGKSYRFDNPGSQVLIDPRDAPSMAAVPNLHRI